MDAEKLRGPSGPRLNLKALNMPVSVFVLPHTRLDWSTGTDSGTHIKLAHREQIATPV